MILEVHMTAKDHSICFTCCMRARYGIVCLVESKMLTLNMFPCFARAGEAERSAFIGELCVAKAEEALLACYSYGRWIKLWFIILHYTP